MTQSRSASRNGLTKLADTVMGDRVRQGIDRRVRKQVDREFVSGTTVLDAQVRALVAEEVAALLAAGDAERAERDFTLSLLLGGKVRGARTLNPARFERLHKQVRQLTGVASAEWQLVQAFRTLLDAETRGLGRIAGSPYNILGKLVVPPLLGPPEGPVLEIGPLYGLSSPALVRSFRRAGQRRELTVIDPFAGLQVQGGENLRMDRTGTPVLEQTARWNFTECGIGADEVGVVNGYSTDDDAKAAVADRAYAVVVIDGDHSEAGVEKDLWWVETLLLPGGIAVMDDYGDKKWPGVETAAQRYLAEGGRLKLLGTASSSAYLQLPE